MSACKKGYQVVANVWCALMHFEKAGDVMAGHKHKFDHQTLLAHGSFRVTVDGEMLGDFDAPMLLTIKAGQNHEFIALTDNAVASCIHPITKGENYDDIVEPDDLPLIGGRLQQSLIV